MLLRSLQFAVSPFMELKEEPDDYARIHIKTRAFPVMTGITAVLAFFTGYVLEAHKNNVEWYTPYLSDGGTYPPESCVFGFLLAMSAFFWICTVFSIHIRLNTHYRTSHAFQLPDVYRLIFLFTMIIGLTSGFGVLIVASVEATHLPLLHIIGCVMAFCGGIFYIWIFLVLTLIIKPSPSKTPISITRGVIIFFASCSFLVLIIFQSNEIGNRTAEVTLKKEGGSYVLRAPWEEWYLLTTHCQWVLALSFLFLILTISFELGPFELHDHKLHKTIDALCLEEEQQQATENANAKNANPTGNNINPAGINAPVNEGGDVSSASGVQFSTPNATPVSTPVGTLSAEPSQLSTPVVTSASTPGAFSAEPSQFSTPVVSPASTPKTLSAEPSFIVIPTENSNQAALINRPMTAESLDELRSERQNPTGSRRVLSPSHVRNPSPNSTASSCSNTPTTRPMTAESLDEVRSERQNSTGSRRVPSPNNVRNPSPNSTASSYSNTPTSRSVGSQTPQRNL